MNFISLKLLTIVNVNVNKNKTCERGNVCNGNPTMTQCNRIVERMDLKEIKPERGKNELHQSEAVGSCNCESEIMIKNL